jgi:hypothetical protein
MNIIDPENNGNSPNIFDLEERYDKEIVPLINELCNKAQEMGAPIFVIACYKLDGKGAWLASSARVRKDFVPKEFHAIRAVVEGRIEIVKI